MTIATAVPRTAAEIGGWDWRNVRSLNPFSQSAGEAQMKKHELLYP